MLKKINQFILFIIVISMNISCSSSKGLLKKTTKNKAAIMVQFKIIDKEGNNISNSCKIGYGENGISPSIKASNGIHFIEAKDKLIVKRLHCLINLRLYSFEFENFLLKLNSKYIYNLGVFNLRYDYKSDYTETKFYKESIYEYRNNRQKMFQSHNLSHGKVSLISKENLNNKTFKRKFPKSKKVLMVIPNLRPKNIAVN